MNEQVQISNISLPDLQEDERYKVVNVPEIEDIWRHTEAITLMLTIMKRNGQSAVSFEQIDHLVTCDPMYKFASGDLHLAVNQGIQWLASNKMIMRPDRKVHDVFAFTSKFLTELLPKLNLRTVKIFQSMAAIPVEEDPDLYQTIYHEV